MYIDIVNHNHSCITQVKPIRRMTFRKRYSIQRRMSNTIERHKSAFSGPPPRKKSSPVHVHTSFSPRSLPMFVAIVSEILQKLIISLVIGRTTETLSRDTALMPSDAGEGV